MRRALAFFVLVSASTAAAIACTTFSSSTTDVGDSGGDAPANTVPPSVVPGTPPPPPADAGSDGTIFFDDFEDGDCSIYQGFVANILPTSTAHAGTHACMICRFGDGGRPQAYRDFDAAAEPGTYTLSYEGKLVDAGPARQAIAAVIFGYGPDAAADESLNGNVFQVTADGWLSVSVGGTTKMPDPTTARAILLGDPAALDGECFAFDEVRLVYKP